MVITEKNKAQVYGRIKKSFDGKDVVTWHTFKGGMKKRISSYTKGVFRYDDMLHQRLSVRHWFKKVIVEINTFGNLLISLSDDDTVAVSVGDEILFLGNRIVIKKRESSFREYGINYSYQCIQIDNGEECLAPKNARAVLLAGY